VTRGTAVEIRVNAPRPCAGARVKIVDLLAAQCLVAENIFANTLEYGVTTILRCSIL